jgi:hypothetical protein
VGAENTDENIFAQLGPGTPIAPSEETMSPEDLEEDPTWQDYGRMVMSGGASVGGGVGWLLEKVTKDRRDAEGNVLPASGVEEFARGIKERSAESARQWMESKLDAIGLEEEGLSDSAKYAMQLELLGEEGTGEAKWNKIKLMTASSLLGTMAGMGAGAVFTKGLSAAGAGLKTARTVGFSTGEAAVAAPAAGAATEDEVKGMTHEQLMGSLEYQAILEGLDLPEAEAQQKAKEILADGVAGKAAALTAISTFVLSAPFGNALGKVAGGEYTGLKGMAVGGLTEAAQEFAQSGSEQISSNVAMQAADPTRGVFDDALESAVSGAAAGGLMGGTMGYFGSGEAPDGGPDPIKDIEDAARRAEEAAAAAGGDNLDQALAGEQAAAERRQFYADQAARLTEEQLVAAEEEEVRVRAQEQLKAAERNEQMAQKERDFIAAEEEKEAAEETKKKEAFKEAEYQAELKAGEQIEAMEKVAPEPVKLGDAQPALIKARQAIQAKEKKAKDVAKALAKKKIADANRAKGKQKPVPKMLEDKSPDLVFSPTGEVLTRKDIAAQQKRMEVDAAAGETPLKPSELKVERRIPLEKGVVKVAVETMSGMTRTGKRADGSTWKTKMRGVDYGFVRGTSGADGDQVDVFINSAESAKKSPDNFRKAFVIDQINPNTGGFDEHKVMVGFESQEDAVRAYKRQYQPGWKVGPVTEMPIEEFNTWVKEGDTKSPVAPVPEFTSEEDFDSIVERLHTKTGKKPKVMFSLPDGMSIQVKEDFGLTGITPLEIAAHDAATDEIVGIISAVEVDDSKQIRIGTSALAPSYKGKRIGLEMYNAVMKRASELGYEVTSDFSVSPDAQRVYEALERRGATVTQNPNATRLENGTLMSNKHNEPVYVVQPAEAQLSLSDFDESAKLAAETPEATHKRYVAETEKVAKTMPGLGELGKDVNIVRNPTEAPAYVAESMLRKNGMRARGVFFPHTGEIYVFTENVSSAQQAVETLIHEGVTHKGLRVLLGDKLGPIMDDIWNSPGMAEKVTKHRNNFMYKYDLEKPGDRRNATEEYVAHLSEMQPDATILRRIKDAIRKVLRGMGILNEWTDNDINALLRESADRLRYTPLNKIKLETEVEIEETGEMFTVEQPADVMWRRVNKRMAIAEKIGACLRS